MAQFDQRLSLRLADLTIAQVKSVPCPHCGAQSGQDCRYVYMATSRDGLHRMRRKAAREMLVSPPPPRGFVND